MPQFENSPGHSAVSIQSSPHSQEECESVGFYKTANTTPCYRQAGHQAKSKHSPSSQALPLEDQFQNEGCKSS